MITRAPRISARKRNILIKKFAQDVQASIAAEDAKVSRPCANRWYRHFRECIYEASRRAPRFFGEVEMDQAEFGGRGAKKMQKELARLKKILTYAEYQKKARIVRGEHKVQVFGILQRGANVYVQIIKRADKRTLIPIVRMIVEDTAVVYTDEWRGFTDLKLDGYKHFSVNHSEEYVNQQGHHANGIESFWAYAKGRLRKFNGIARTTLPLHLKESEWRWNVGSAERGLSFKARSEKIEKALATLLSPYPQRS